MGEIIRNTENWQAEDYYCTVGFTADVDQPNKHLHPAQPRNTDPGLVNGGLGNVAFRPFCWWRSWKANSQQSGSGGSEGALGCVIPRVDDGHFSVRILRGNQSKPHSLQVHV